MAHEELKDGAKLDGVILETVEIPGSAEPVAKAVSGVSPNVNVRLDTSLCREFPVGTRFRAKATLRQRRPKGQLYLVVDHASVMVDSIPDENLRAILGRMKKDSSAAQVRNCRSAYKCSVRWSELLRTDQPGVRHCAQCSENVVLCNTIADIRRETQAGNCIAVKAATVADQSSDPVEDFVGLIEDDGARTF